jgi:hypothetical protein
MCLSNKACKRFCEFDLYDPFPAFHYITQLKKLGIVDIYYLDNFHLMVLESSNNAEGSWPNSAAVGTGMIDYWKPSNPVSRDFNGI